MTQKVRTSPMNTTIADSTISNTANCYSHCVNTIEKICTQNVLRQAVNYKSNDARRRHFMGHWTGHMTVPVEYVAQYMTVYMYVIMMAIKVQLQFIG